MPRLTRAEAEEALDWMAEKLTVTIAPWQREFAVRIFCQDPDQPLILRGPYRNV